jgi:Protein of unknown function (DUF1203)
MARYRYAGIPAALAAEARQSMISPQYGHPAHREVATGTGPCRVCLRTFHVGEEDRLLFTYQPFLEVGALPAPGPIFVHADGCARYDALELPPDFRSLPVVVEGFRSGGTLVVQARVDGEPTEAVVDRVFAEQEVAYVHLRNGEAGCFMARVERA